MHNSWLKEKVRQVCGGFARIDMGQPCISCSGINRLSELETVTLSGSAENVTVDFMKNDSSWLCFERFVFRRHMEHTNLSSGPVAKIHYSYFFFYATSTEMSKKNNDMKCLRWLEWRRLMDG